VADPAQQPDVEVISWLDDCTRYALHVSAHQRITGPIVVTTFRESLTKHGVPASTLTDNGMVRTVRLAGGRVAKNFFSWRPVASSRSASALTGEGRSAGGSLRARVLPPCSPGGETTNGRKILMTCFMTLLVRRGSRFWRPSVTTWQ
jgi:hypothetical protein